MSRRNDDDPRDEDPPTIRSESEASDADSDLEELQGDIAKFDASVRDFLASHRGADKSAPAAAGSSAPSIRGGSSFRGRLRGPRQAAKPRGDITARLSKVNQAFLAGDYERALDLASEVVRINAETHQAWTTLASVFREMGEINKYLSASVYAAHLRPKEVHGWLQCASTALEIIETQGDDPETLHTARLCYSAALRADSKNLEARLGKANVCHRQGHLAVAINEYKHVLRRHPDDLDVVRQVAEAALDSKHSESAVNSAVAAYKKYFEIQLSNPATVPDQELWHDFGIYIELQSSRRHFQEAIQELRRLARWLVGRSSETYWDEYDEDDREWDAENTRRRQVPQFKPAEADVRLYGDSLPLDLRGRLAVFRLGLEHDEEAFKHMSWLDPTEHHTREFAQDFPFLVYELACELTAHDHPAFAAKYLEVLREVAGEPDAAVLLQLGRAYLYSREQAAAEECLLTALEIDPDAIEPRVELANLYELAREDEEALILAAEAMALREARTTHNEAEARTAAGGQRQSRAGQRKSGTSTRRKPQARPADSTAPRKSVIPRRYRPKRLGAPGQRRQEEQEHAAKLSRQYETVVGLKESLRAGHLELKDEWMQSSQALVDDFRSLKQFYSWDKYLQLLGAQNSFQPPAQGQPGSELFQLYERLTRTLVPQPDQARSDTQASGMSGHQGISFDQWLDIFLDYAVGLAIDFRREESYRVCEAARDSTVFQSSAHNFRIHIAWSICTVFTNDEEKAVQVARHLMKDGINSDSDRMFSLLASLCQSPIIWYTSGPAQKFVLRQIRALDTEQMTALSKRSDIGDEVNKAPREDIQLDACLLMMYGHILFTSTSYTYALGYFLRAHSLDPENPMISLSIGLAYVHYALKRQAVNRQYLILQGLAFLTRYVELCKKEDSEASLAELYYNSGRLHHLLGISSLALQFYSQAASYLDKDDPDMKDLGLMIATNQIITHLGNDRRRTALKLVKEQVIL